VNRSPLIAFAGGTVVIAVMVLAAFANLASAGEQTCPRSKASQSQNKEWNQASSTKNAVNN
jgi:hypothetical protein